MQNRLNRFNTPSFQILGKNCQAVSTIAEIPCAIRLTTQSHEPLTSTNRQTDAREVSNQDAEY
jgi:hypothetical protein